MDNIRAFPCDPKKNVECKARYKEGWCGVECKETLHEEYAKKDMFGKFLMFLNDWAFGVAPDETTPKSERHDAEIVYKTLQEVISSALEFMKDDE